MYIAIDPGETTGLAYSESGASFRGIELETAKEIAFIWNTLSNLYPTMVICESFTHRQRDKVSYAASEAIGVVKLYCSLNLVPLHFQTPSEGKGYFNNEKLKKLGAYFVGMPHARDASRHLCHYLMTQGLLDLARLK